MTFDELLDKKRMTVYKLSKVSTVPRTTLFDIYTGKANIMDCSGRNLYKIAKALNISIEELLNVKQMPYHPAYERNIPEFLSEEIARLKSAKRKNSSSLDCYYDELNSSINVCEVENIISKEQADYLRTKYL